MTTRQKALFVAHRIPYPPNKGDKIRSWQIFQFLAERFDLAGGFFVDDPDDWQHVQHLEQYCVSLHAEKLTPRHARIRSLTGFVTGEPLTVPYYASRGMDRWVTEQRKGNLDLEVYFSSGVGRYLAGATAPAILDMVDADSAKWTAYADRTSFPASWIYRREGARLARVEAALTARTAATLLVSEQDADIVRALPGAAEHKIHCLPNGVDLDYFNPDGGHETLSDPPDLVFTGAMDYWPNIDAVTWFAKAVWPQIRRANPDLKLAIVGAKPTAEVVRLNRHAGIEVTGRVPDIRPWLHSAQVAVAPLRIARGIQNKVLEAMAMAKPVVMTSDAAAGIGISDGTEAIIEDDPDQMADRTLQLFADAEKLKIMSAKARNFVEAHHGWSQMRRELEKLLRGLVTLK